MDRRKDNVKNNGQRGGIDICQLTGYYCPHTDFGHYELIQQGELFPIFNNRQVIWMLLEPTKALEKKIEVTA